MRWAYPITAGIVVAGGLALHSLKEWADRDRAQIREYLVSQAQQGNLLIGTPAQERWLRQYGSQHTADIFGDKTPEEFYIFEDDRMGKHLVLTKVDGRPASESIDKIFNK